MKTNELLLNGVDEINLYTNDYDHVEVKNISGKFNKKVYCIKKSKYGTLLFTIDKVTNINKSTASTEFGELIEIDIARGKIYKQRMQNDGGVYKIKLPIVNDIINIYQLFGHYSVCNLLSFDYNRDYNQSVFRLLSDEVSNMLMLNYIYNNTTNNVKGRNDCELLDRNDQKLDSILNLNKNELFNLCVSISLRKNRPSKMSVYSRLMFNTNEGAEKRRRKLLNYFKNIKLSQPVELEFA